MAFKTKDGRFVLCNLRPGTSDIVVAGPGFATKVIPGVEIGAGETHLGRVEVQHGFTVRGSVRTISGDPVADAIVTITQSDPSAVRSSRNVIAERALGNLTGTTNADGTFTIDGFEARLFSVRKPTIAAETSAGETSAPQVIAVGDLDVQLTVSDAGSIEGEVMGVAEAVVLVEGTTRSLGRYQTIARYGHFEFPRIAAGDYRVYAIVAASSSHPGTMYPSITATVRPGETIRLTLAPP